MIIARTIRNWLSVLCFWSSHCVVLIATPLDEFVERSRNAQSMSQSNIDQLIEEYQGSSGLLSAIAEQVAERRAPEALPLYRIIWSSVPNADSDKARIAVLTFRDSDAANARWTTNLLRWTDRTAASDDAEPGLSLYSDYIQRSNGGIDARLAAYCLSASPRQSASLFRNLTSVTEAQVEKLEAKVFDYLRTSAGNIDKRRQIFSELEQELWRMIKNDDWFADAYAARLLARIGLTGTDLGKYLAGKKDALTNFLLTESRELDFGGIKVEIVDAKSAPQARLRPYSSSDPGTNPNASGTIPANAASATNSAMREGNVESEMEAPHGSFPIVPIAIVVAIIVAAVTYLLQRRG